MPMLPPAQGLSHPLFSIFRSNGLSLFNNYVIRPGGFVDEMESILLYGYNGVQHAVFRYIPHAAPVTAAPELVDLESQHETCQNVSNSSRGPTATPLHPVPNVDSHSTLETDDSTMEGGTSAIYGERGSHHKSLALLRRARTRKVTFVVGVLSVIVLPGLIVGVMTRQMSWGFELSGAIAPIVSLLAGLYYHGQK